MRQKPSCNEKNCKQNPVTTDFWSQKLTKKGQKTRFFEKCLCTGLDGFAQKWPKMGSKTPLSTKARLDFSVFQKTGQKLAPTLSGSRACTKKRPKMTTIAPNSSTTKTPNSKWGVPYDSSQLFSRSNDFGGALRRSGIAKNRQNPWVFAGA